MRIAYFCPDVETPGDGPLCAALRVSGLVRPLLRLGHEVRVFTPIGGAEVLGGDIPVVELRVRPFEERTATQLESDPNLGPEAASEARSLYAAVLRRRADVPVREFAPHLVIERSSLFGGAGLTIARKAKIPIVVDVVAPVVDPGASGRTRLRPAWIRNADYLLAATPQLAAWLRTIARHGDQVRVLAGGIDVEQFEAAARRRHTLRARLQLAGREIVGFVGDLDASHDLEPLILAMGLIERQGIDPHLVIVGDGGEREALERVVRAVGLSDVITFAGRVAPAEIAEYVVAFDAAVAPSSDGSLELLSYLAAARPLAAPDVQHHHCLESGKTAWFYAPSDPGSLALAVGIILRNPRWAGDIAAAGRAHVRDHHSWEQNAREVAGLVDDPVTSRTDAGTAASRKTRAPA
jgi:glycosyltransferase involved in cell wall biosynthesis